jgi:hypothetical protein
MNFFTLKPGIWAVGRWRPTAVQKTAQLWRVLIGISALAGGDTESGDHAGDETKN